MNKRMTLLRKVRNMHKNMAVKVPVHPQLRIYWQLVTAGRGTVSLLSECGPWNIVHVPGVGATTMCIRAVLI